ncbi:serine hydrolase [Nocardiopsis sediminis]|uniref:Serine hydrolase n=1 Tax=Nocardiopsis sediminis TaxID=1778267 RepID=A0ABV8FS84_9ACTN
MDGDVVVSPVEVLSDLTAQQYEDAFRELSGVRGLRLVDVCGYEAGGQARYAGIWDFVHGPHPESYQWTAYAIPVADYQSVFQARMAEGYRPMRITPYSVAGQTLIAAIWETTPGPPWASRHDFNVLNLPTHLREVRRQGYRVADICFYSSLEPNPDYPGPPPAPLVRIARFSSIWVQSDGRDWDVFGPLTADEYQAEFDRQNGLGRLPVRATGFNVGDSGDQQHFVGLWEPARGLPYEAHHGIDDAGYQADSVRLGGDGWRQLCVGAYSAGYGDAATPRFNPIWELRLPDPVIAGLAAKFMNDYEVPGLSMAVAKDGQLVHAAGYGLADKDAGTPVTTSSLFRIASLTKPITSSALMNLANQGRVALQDLVFGPNGHLSDLGTPADARAANIIVRHLLEHACGGWANDSHDPMYTNPTLDQRQLISWVLANRPLDNVPGTAYAYSNFGYCVLGRIIEHVTGRTYADHVSQDLLAPCGVTDMSIAGNTLADRRPDEVVYYGLDGDDPYSMQVHRMDSHGGWVATATDVLRFLVRVDGFPSPPDVVPEDWITAMTTPSGLPGSEGYAMGWWVDARGTRWHTGYLPGTTSVLVRTHDGYCWVAVVNTGREDKANPDRDTEHGLSELMWDVHDQVDVWPAGQPL